MDIKARINGLTETEAKSLLLSIITNEAKRRYDAYVKTKNESMEYLTLADWEHHVFTQASLERWDVADERNQ